MKKQKRLIAVCLPATGIWREITLGFQEAASVAEWALWTIQEHDVRNVVTAMHFQNTQAILISSGWHQQLLSSDFRRKVLRKVLVAVEADLTSRSIPSVRVDDTAIGRIAADHLLDQGQREFSAFGWPDSFFLARAQAFEQRVIERGGRFHTRWNQLNLRSGHNERETYENSILTWIQKLPRPVAILAGTDSWGQGLNLVLYHFGIRVPEDVAVIGVDNETLMCETSLPPLSSVAVPWRKVGAEAAGLIADALASPRRHNEPAPLVLVPPSGVVVRPSSDMLAVTDRNVADALRVIRDQAVQPLSVAEILRHVPIGRHALQRAFRKHVGRTILDEIHRVRVEHAKGILATTDLPMPEVASRSGFISPQRLAKIFRREVGTSPGAYRRTFRTLITK